MTSILLTVTGAEARAEVEGILTSGMVGVPVTIRCDGAWTGLTKNLVCRCGQCGPARTVAGVEDAAAVAPEALEAPKRLYLGLEGYNSDGSLVIPTTWADCGPIEEGAAVDADPAADPSLPFWGQLQTEVRLLREQRSAGWSAAAVTLLEAILGSCATASDQAANIAALIALLNAQEEAPGGESGGESGGEEGGEDSGGEPGAYTVTLALDRVTASNTAQSVTAGAVYVNRLSVGDGYTLGVPVITMGGVDVTDRYYDGAGNIAIAAVTGDLSITCRGLRAERLKLVSIGTTLPDTATFAYTATSAWSQLVLAEESETTGGEVAVSWDTSAVTGGVNVRLYLFKDGQPHKLGAKTNSVGEPIEGINGRWVDAGFTEYNGYIATTEPFRVKIPDGCTVMLAFQRGTLASDTVTSNGTFAAWVRDGGLTVDKTEV